MLVKKDIRQAFVICLFLAMAELATGRSSWEVCWMGTVVPPVKNFKFTLYPSGVTWEDLELPPGSFLASNTFW